ncbi:hypothetical protein [Microbacterium sp. 77mftsu3.1]|uniref:hypothetical protein n=1 Tax=Microbacterium sp. 77mftsu3.1 TaxID=1761802 RepID=UPI000382521B|nr:hypothetical protein [Microbacterium sp. 77mftsu3.1]SDH42788.1 hypothetical protein SAMN04488590_3316 [Microbacterium sp. 77mftsu3.1]
MPTPTVDFHLPLPWFLELDTEAGNMVATKDELTEAEGILAEAYATFFGTVVRDFGSVVRFPGDRWSAWGTDAVRGQARRVIVAVPEDRLQELARTARFLGEQTLHAGGNPSGKQLVVTATGDETTELY